MDMLVETLSVSGFQVTKSGGTFFLYMRAPRAATTDRGGRIEFESGEAVSQWLIREKLISTVPWDDAEPAIRFSVTFAAQGEEEENRVIREIADRLGDVRFEF